MPPRAADPRSAFPPGHADRLLYLDGLRGFLAMYVTLSHAVPFGALPAWLCAVFSHGGAAVDVFFALSGFVIARSWETHGADPRRFFAARSRRIYPAYFCVLLLAIPVQLIPLPLGDLRWAERPASEIWSGEFPPHGLIVLALHLLMAHGMVPNDLLPHAWIGWLGAAWSLSTEWQFYMLVACFGPYLGRGQRFVLRLTLLLLCIAALGFVYDLATPPGWHFSRAFLPEKAAHFALGVASAGAFAQRPGRRWLLLLALGVCIACSIHGGGGKAVPPVLWVACLLVQRWPSTPILRALARLLGSACALRLGAISFSLYLVNVPVQKVLGVALGWLAAGDAHMFTLAWLPLAIALPLGAAALLHTWVEEPWRRPSRARAEVGLEGPHAGVAQW